VMAVLVLVVLVLVQMSSERLGNSLIHITKSGYQHKLTLGLEPLQLHQNSPSCLFSIKGESVSIVELFKLSED
jgi:hypothetical protein